MAMDSFANSKMRDYASWRRKVVEDKKPLEIMDDDNGGGGGALEEQGPFLSTGQ